MKYTKFGNTDINVSSLSFGCWELGGTQWELTSDEINLKVLQTAFDQGITSFDTAEGYGHGHSEEIVGQALKNCRNNVFWQVKSVPSICERLMFVGLWNHLCKDCKRTILISIIFTGPTATFLLKKP